MKPMRNGAFLQRLARNTSGNTLAIMAAAFFPLAGLIGGGVDMTRIYITKTRLQQACDAGALAGRKVMAAGSWTTSGASSSRGRAYQMFAANFESGDFGTEGLTREFTESQGTVTGVASADVPMTLMKIFGKATQDVSVTCTAQMEIPNTDVMFVLDVTYSMVTDDKIGGLKSAVKCFYEALLRVNTTEVCGGDPTASAYGGSAQIRLGFVPYGVNVNVGKLLPNGFLSDSWTYQTRQARFAPVWAWTAGSESPITYGGWTPGSTPSNYNNAGNYGGSWFRISGSSATIDGTSYPRQATPATSANCASNYNLMSGSSGTLAARSDIGESSPGNDLESSSVPVYPDDTTQTLEYSQTDTRTVTGYRYRWFNPSGSDGNGCWLEYNADQYDREREGSSTKSITWTQYQNFTDWSYDDRSLTVSGLKAGGSNWNNSVTFTDLAWATGPTVKLSGSNSNTQLKVPTDTIVAWDGCIEERPTFQNTDGNPTDEWDPVPSAALDMLISHVPSAATPAQAWGPMLPDAVWGRYTGGSTRTTNEVITTSNLNRNRNYYCPTEARRLAEYDTVGDLETYINSLSATSLGTYHDIGLLWGARLLSPTGLFAGDNALTANGGAIERHLIFMTDGNAQTVVDNLYAFGLPWWDRRQTSYAPSTGNLDSLVESRLPAICNAVRNMNVTLWVISYGAGVDATNEARLEACATPGRYYDAEDGDALIAQFKQIASEIADLRLTQ